MKKLFLLQLFVSLAISCKNVAHETSTNTFNGYIYEYVTYHLTETPGIFNYIFFQILN